MGKMNKLHRLLVDLYILYGGLQGVIEAIDIIVSFQMRDNEEDENPEDVKKKMLQDFVSTLPVV